MKPIHIPEYLENRNKENKIKLNHSLKTHVTLHVILQTYIFSDKIYLVT